MKLKKTPVDLDGNDGNIHILRNRHGNPEITASTVADLMRGLGWIHANDRQMQTLLTRILLQGRAAELLKADEGLTEIDICMWRINFLPDPQEQVARIGPGARKALDAYLSGFNDWMGDNGPVFEFKLMGYRLERPGCAFASPCDVGGRVAQPASPLQCLEQLGRGRPSHPLRLSNIVRRSP